MFISRVINLTQTNEFKFNSLKELAEFTLKHDWSPFTFKDGYRHGTSWSSCDIMALDIDEGCTVAEAKELFKDYEHVILASKSHQKEKNGKVLDRFRVIIPLSETIKDQEIYKNTWYFLSNKYPFIDQQCKDFGRYYFLSKSLLHYNLGKPLSPVTVNIMPKVYEKPKLELKLTKGKLSRATMEFIINGAAAGQRNIATFKAAKDFQEQGYTIEEAKEKLANTPALDKDFQGRELEQTIRSAYTNDPKYDPRAMSEKRTLIASNVIEIENDPNLYTKNDPVYGPSFLDVTEERWRKGEILGIVAGSGGGKSAISLKIIKDIIHNNTQNDDIHFFFSLEMPKRQIIKRWQKLVGKASPDSHRLYVVDNKNTEERLTWQHIVRYVQDTCKHEGKKVGSVVIDHLQVLSDKIDTTMEPNFDVSLDINSGRGKIKTIKTKEMCRLMKVVAEYLNCFLIVQNQSTIERAGDGDTPMGIHSAYGAADFAWFSDYIVTVWQPLKRVQSETFLTASGWQYSKIREVGLNDLTKTYTRHTLYYDLATGDFRPLNELEEDEFNKMVEKANTMRDADVKKRTTQYKGSPKARESYQRKLELVKDKKDD